MNSYLTLRKFPGHPNTCKLLNGCHPLMEKKNMILLTEEWKKKILYHPSKCQKQKQFQCEKAATNSGKGQRKGTSHKTIQPALQTPKYPAGCKGKCVSDGQNYDGITEKVGRQIKISEMMSDIMDAIQNLYIAINDVKIHISDKNSPTCNSIKTNNPGLSLIHE
ncbi:hypothetical protein O181_096633 [Austropuccinia psidii MF-1]|uniref:Uncharacterized protein n=1 Tax=Austropuccinia psidii MF-1 TaxID=1389203 RepID=A0A9Q3J7C0_9BASI|nr:hypothetical protein [Austropuccinia psidii MF-1]